MYAYSAAFFGLPHWIHSPVVSGIEASSIVLMTSTNGTSATTALNRSGRRLVTAPISRPPALPPLMVIRSFAVYRSRCRYSAAAMKSVKVFIFFSILPSSYQPRPISWPPRMCAIA